MISRKTAIIAIFIAQVLVMATLHIVRNKGLWQSKRSVGFAVFSLDVGYVFISLVIAGLVS